MCSSSIDCLTMQRHKTMPWRHELFCKTSQLTCQSSKGLKAHPTLVVCGEGTLFLYASQAYLCDDMWLVTGMLKSCTLASVVLWERANSKLPTYDRWRATGRECLIHKKMVPESEKELGPHQHRVPMCTKRMNESGIEPPTLCNGHSTEQGWIA